MGHFTSTLVIISLTSCRTHVLISCSIATVKKIIPQSLSHRLPQTVWTIVLYVFSSCFMVLISIIPNTYCCSIKTYLVISYNAKTLHGSHCIILLNMLALRQPIGVVSWSAFYKREAACNDSCLRRKPNALIEFASPQIHHPRAQHCALKVIHHRKTLLLWNPGFRIELGKPVGNFPQRFCVTVYWFPPPSQLCKSVYPRFMAVF